MRVCIVCSEHSPWGGIGLWTRAVARLLGTRHEVTLIQVGGDRAPPPPEPPGVRVVTSRPSLALEGLSFSCDSHCRSAAVMAAIEETYADVGPDYMEVVDYHAGGLVPLQARAAGHPLLRGTLVAVRLAATVELLSLHDGTLFQPGIELVAALEREQLRLADRILWPGGDTLDMYQRYYPEGILPEAIRVPVPFEHPPSPPHPPPRDTGGPLKLLFVGRLQRFKGALDLVEACLGLDDDNWELTMIGADTATAPAGQSVRMTIEAMCGEDPRIRLVDPMPNEELQRRWPEHDLLVLPSTLEIWGNVGVEAMRAGLPVLASPVGGPAGYVEDGVSGWHTDGLGPAPIRRALSRLLSDREELECVRASGAVYERFERVAGPQPAMRGYEELLSSAPLRRPRPAASSGPFLVTGVVPYYRGHEHIEEAVGSLLEQSHRNLEVLIVNDGSFEEEDAVLDRLAADPRVTVVTQLNRGEAGARNLGAALARGEYLTMLDADNLLERNFVARALEAFRLDPGLSYVTSWLRYVQPDGSELEAGGYAPLGNRVVEADSNDSHESNNWDGDAVALLPRRLFSDLGYGYERTAGMQADWELYRQLREDGRFGAVIPELLARYRVRPDSLSRGHDLALYKRTWGEARTRRRKRSTRWIAEATDG
jgi:glycogen synthase